jgi:hypothetical protein
VPYWIHAKVKDSSFSVVVETAKDALSKVAELADLGHTEVIAKDDPCIPTRGTTALRAQTGSTRSSTMVTA